MKWWFTQRWEVTILIIVFWCSSWEYMSNRVAIFSYWSIQKCTKFIYREILYMEWKYIVLIVRLRRYYSSLLYTGRVYTKYLEITKAWIENNAYCIVYHRYLFLFCIYAITLLYETPDLKWRKSYTKTNLI